MQSMDLEIRLLAAAVVPSTKVNDALTVFVASWLLQFWHPDVIRRDTAFMLGSFKDYCDSVSIPLQQAVPQRHAKNAIESKHNIIRSIFLRLKTAVETTFNRVCSIRDAYGIE
eukprot:gb/GEZJ01005123.1/.p1 GENE.gb/GEZJ01005123.1/~~gb/GEZJ01005123.1/.p1  ORF type:complete len:113 (+),score=6.87 gb/GEZJ01005123.1/:1115-1453(+)